MKYLRVEQIIALHALLIDETGGSSGVRDVGRLESVVAAQNQVVFGAPLHSTAYQKAAVLIRNIIGDHPFVDGNKRTAMLAGLTFLDVNGFRLQIAVGELEDFAVRVAVEHLSIDQIATWLEAHATATNT